MSVAVKGIANDQGFKALLAVTIQMSKEMTARQISNCMWALSTLRQRAKSVLVALCFRWNGALETASAFDNSQFFWALGSLGYIPDTGFLDRLIAKFVSTPSSEILMSIDCSLTPSRFL